MTTKPDELVLIVGAVLVAALAIWFTVQQLIEVFKTCDPPLLIERFGYLEGSPDCVRCSVCGTAAECVGHFRRNNERWSEWHCPRCVK